MKDGTTYSYVINEMFNKRFGYYYDTSGQTYNVRLFIYKINTNSKMPFLSILLNNDNNVYKFIEYSYNSTLTEPVDMNEYEYDDFIQKLETKLKELFQEKKILGGQIGQPLQSSSVKPYEPLIVEPNQNNQFQYNQNQDNQFQDNQFQDNQLQDNQFQDNHFQDNQFQDNKLQDNQFQDNKLQDNKLQDNKLQDNQLQDNKLQDNQIQDNQNQDNQFQDNQFQDNQLQDNQNQDNQNQDNNLQDNQLQDNKLQDNQNQDNKLQDNQLQDNKLQDNQNQDNKLQDNQFQDNQNQDNKLQDNQFQDNQKQDKENLYSTIEIENQYKGIITNYPENIITVILNFSDFTNELPESYTQLNNSTKLPVTTVQSGDYSNIRGYKYVLLDEIINKKNIDNIPIDNEINEFLKDNDYLMKINDIHLQPIPFPKKYYLCKQENGEYINIEKINEISKNFIPTTFIEGKGNFFLFSETPILKNEKRDLIQFSIIFDENGENVLNDNSGFFSSFKPFDEKYLFNTFTQINTKYLFLKSLEYVLDI